MKLENNKKERNWNWIEANRKRAYEFAENFDPFRRNNVQAKYDPMAHDVLRITAFETRIEFVLIRAKASKRATISHALGYEYPPYDYDDMLEETFNFFKKKLEVN
jgi:hypothetical protein